MEADPAGIATVFDVTRADGSPVSASDYPSQRLVEGREAPPLLARCVDRRSGEERWLLIKANVLDEGERLIVSIIEDVSGAR
jgi:hypothetical protein